MFRDDFLTFVRPINYYDGGEYIWGAGTCFFVRYLEDIYMIAAEHSLSASYSELSKLHVFLEGSKECVSFRGAWRYSALTSCGEVEEDIVALRVSKESVHYTQLRKTAIVMPVQAFSAVRLEIGDRIFVCGYPVETKECSADGTSIVDELLFRDGIYSGCKDELYAVECRSTYHSLDGMSGSPVFVERGERVLLVGLLVAAAKDGRIMHFLSSNCICNLVALVSDLSVRPDTA